MLTELVKWLGGGVTAVANDVSPDLSMFNDWLDLALEKRDWGE